MTPRRKVFPIGAKAQVVNSDRERVDLRAERLSRGNGLEKMRGEHNVVCVDEALELGERASKVSVGVEVNRLLELIQQPLKEKRLYARRELDYVVDGCKIESFPC
jgi:hypothetical protein